VAGFQYSADGFHMTTATVTEPALAPAPALSDEEIREHALRLIHAQGATKAAGTLGIARESVLSLAAGARVRAGTLALARERLRSQVVLVTQLKTERTA
jgi:hypothetical protein